MTEPTTMGTYLRAARRKRRVSIERAAEETRIRADYLMRMESDEFDFLAPTYVRGFLRSYARFLSLDPDPLTDEFDSRFGSTKADTSSIIAMERRVKHAPKERRSFNNWSMAAAFAAAVLLFLGIYGIILGPETSEEPRDQVARNGGGANQGEPDQDVPQPEPTPSPTPSPTQPRLALAEGIDLKIVAETGRCWLQVYTDGVENTQLTLELGQSQRYRAEDEMTVLLGNAQGVELIVNGYNIGSPGGTVKTVEIPADIKSLL